MTPDGSITSLLAEAERVVASDPDQAQRLLENVLARDPSHVVAGVRLGRLRLASDDAHEALNLAERALAVDPANRWALILKGQAAEAMFEPDLAHKVWSALAQAHPAPPLEGFAKSTPGESAYRTGIARPHERVGGNPDPIALVASGDVEVVLDEIDALMRVVDTAALERLWRALPEGVLRDYLDFRLWFRMQAYAEPLALADRLIVAPELIDRQGEIQGLAARAALMLEDQAAIERWVPANDPPPTGTPQRLLNAVWRGDPERGLRLARRIAYSAADSSNAEGLHVFLPLLRDDPQMAEAHLAAHLARHKALKARPSIELTMAAASVWWTQRRFDLYASAFAAYFRGYGLENPVPTDGRPLSFDRLSAATPRRSDGPLVSLIITVFNAEATLGYALRSLQNQTHGNLQILAVDDRSSDGSLAMLHEAAASDPRITVIANERNLGTYVSKNRALEQARGEYWVCHDGDDWAHPRRIERHVAAMEEDPQLVATRSNWLRIDAEGMPFIRRTSGGWTHINPGSPFYRRREVLEAVGVYDRVRIDGDLDHWRRTLDHFGPTRLALLRQPLTLGLLHPGSLTRSGTGAQNDEHYSPPRSAYRFAGLQWRRSRVDRGDLKMTGEPGPRPFPAPDGMAAD